MAGSPLHQGVHGKKGRQVKGDQKQPAEPLCADAETITVSLKSEGAEVEAVSRSRRSALLAPCPVLTHSNTQTDGVRAGLKRQAESVKVSHAVKKHACYLEN